MLSPITATMELFKSFETSFSTVLSKFSQQENYELFQRRDRNNMVWCSSNGTPFNSHLILFPITAIIESEERFVITDFYNFPFSTQQQNQLIIKLRIVSAVGPEGDSVCFSGEFWATKKAPESMPVGLG